MAVPEEKEGYQKARQELLEASNDHAVMDVAAIIAFFAMITKVVDVNGFHNPLVTNAMSRACTLLIYARAIREFVLMLPRMILSFFGIRGMKGKQA